MSEHLVLISCDSHLGGNHVDFSPYLEGKYAQAYQDYKAMAVRAAEVMAQRGIDPAKADMNDGASQMAMLQSLQDADDDGSVPFSAEMIANNQRQRKEVLESLGIDWNDNQEFMSVPGEDDPDLRLKMLEYDGTPACVLFPQVGFILGDFNDPGAKWAGIRAYNRFAAEYASTHPDRYAATFMVDLDDIDRACEEAVWAKEHGMRGGAYIAGGKPPGLPTFNQLYYEPFFKTLEEVELPFNMHGAFNATDSGTGWQKGPGAAAFNQVWISYLPLNKGGPLMHFVAGGVFERHPKLKVVVAETGGITWAKQTLDILDGIYDSASAPVEGARQLNDRMRAALHEFPRKPSEYFAEHVFIEGDNNPLDWAILHEVGIGNVLWGSDFPHAEAAWPSSMEGIAANIARSGVSFEDAQQYLGGNAAELYGFDLAALQPVADDIGPTMSGAGAR